jgi:hypothetical protein
MWLAFHAQVRESNLGPPCPYAGVSSKSMTGSNSEICFAFIIDFFPVLLQLNYTTEMWSGQVMGWFSCIIVWRGGEATFEKVSAGPRCRQRG